MPTTKETPPRGKLIAAFLAVYLIWGSTFLAIRFAIETLPPFLMAGVRFIIAGALLYGWSRMRGADRPTRPQWIAAAIVGTLLLMGGNGAVVWAEQRVPSGIAALLVAITPCWMVLLDWLRPGGDRPAAQVGVGLLLGLAGLVLLVGPSSIMGAGAVDLLGAIVLLFGALSWSVGSIYSRQAPFPKAPLLATGMQMLVGGTVLVFAGTVAGEPGRIVWDAITLKSAAALIYLIVFGALVGYSAYVWLLRVTTAALAGTYAYVNPVVAVLLGWALADEPLTLRMLLAAAVILSGVALITLAPRAGGSARTRRPRRGRSGPSVDATPRTYEA
jgi:drug/metabolite transporter (DMT)-like permease